MATKWKNFTRSSWVKAAAWLLALLMAGLAAWQAASFAQYATGNNLTMMDAGMVLHKDLPATYLARDLYDSAQELLYSTSYADEATIKAGDSIDEEALIANIYSEYFDTFYDSAIDDNFSNEEAESIRTHYPAEEGSDNYLTDEILNDVVTKAESYGYISDSGDAYNFRDWLSYNRGVYQYFRNQLIQDQLDQLDVFTEKSFDYQTKYDYYAYHVGNSSGGAIPSNVSAADAQNMTENGSGYFLVCKISSYDVSFYSDTVDHTVLDALGYEYTNNVAPYDASSDFYNSQVYIAMKPDVLQSMQDEWAETHNHLLLLVAIECVAGIVFLLCLIVLCCGAGRRPNDDKAYLVWYDRIWAEVLYILFFCILAAWIALVLELIDIWGYTTASAKYMLLCSTTMLFAASGLLLVLSQARRIKAKQWANGWICWRLIRKLCKRYIAGGIVWLYQQVRTSPLRMKIVLLSVGVAVVYAICAFLLMAVSYEPACITLPLIFIVCFAIFYGIRAADRFETITQAAADIRAGRTDTKIKLNGGGPEINGLADNLNQISEGLQDAVTTAVKSERLKSELISNVSHDIKTPLTSIITYIDLLKKCNIPDATAQEYIAVLDQKAQRLRTLTLDLFDASKASSGAMQLELAQTDFDALLRQALGERSEHIEKAGLDVRIRSTPPMYVLADGRLLWRILDNLISNFTRYAAPSSRIYIDMESTGDFVTVTMKNISAVELNISADELMQRFTRGDRSRHTEGSGLGLSIAQSLAELMGGSCHVEIDGDLFKAIVSIPKWTDPASLATT
ncbi:MAG: HAMP domain-containing sensor histidine kinase [Eubacteriales bacterium]|nr:HAMP domain-containing sensor histidine kinase [Eubacteriales bacterium]